jgi:hypothetical protein
MAAEKTSAEVQAMTSIRIETTIEGETLYLPQLRPLLGKSVEIVVKELRPSANDAVGANWASPLAGTVTEYREPFAPAASSGEWEASR